MVTPEPISRLVADMAPVIFAFVAVSTPLSVILKLPLLDDILSY